MYQELSEHILLGAEGSLQAFRSEIIAWCGQLCKNVEDEIVEVVKKTQSENDIITEQKHAELRDLIHTESEACTATMTTVFGLTEKFDQMSAHQDTLFMTIEQQVEKLAHLDVCLDEVRSAGTISRILALQGARVVRHMVEAGEGDGVNSQMQNSFCQRMRVIESDISEAGDTESDQDSC